jgi:NitT/TauT family transport system substrate-binding protein
MSGRSCARLACVFALFVLVVSTVGCRGKTSSSAETDGGKVTLRLGYFPNLTHAPAIVGLEKGFFTDTLGSGVTLKPSTFNAGPAAVEALFSDAIDAAFIGPNPAINAFAKSNGEAIRIVSGATSGGAALVVKPSINSASDLKGKKIASPQLGNTQDVALRTWLGSQNLKTDLQGGGDVSVVPQENSQTLETFRSGDIDGAWVPEPWATRLVQEGGGKVLVDEKTLWPKGKFVTTHLIVRTEFLKAHRDAVRGLIEGLIAATDYLNSKPEDSRHVVNGSLEKITGKKLAPNVIDTAWSNLLFTTDPIASSLAASAQNATGLGLLEKVNLDGIYDVTLLNQLLSAEGKPEVKI